MAKTTLLIPYVRDSGGKGFEIVEISTPARAKARVAALHFFSPRRAHAPLNLFQNLQETPHMHADSLGRPLLLEPHLTERPWGGTRLGSTLGKKVPIGGGPFGESWELSDHPDGLSHLAEPVNGRRMAFGDLLRQEPSVMVGRNRLDSAFPLLVKYIDAEGDLSVQVHPDDSWCRANGHPDRGKSECWYVMDCDLGSTVVFGYRAGVTEAAAREALSGGRLMELLHIEPIHPGDFITIPARSVHAIMAGTLICEIQQSSNTTFRLYDWDRQPARELHIEESMEVSEFDPSRLPPIQHLGPVASRSTPMPVVLVENEFFIVEYLDMAPGERREKLELAGAPGTILNVVAGDCLYKGATPWRTGQTWFLPAAMEYLESIEAGAGGLRLLLSRSREL